MTDVDIYHLPDESFSNLFWNLFNLSQMKSQAKLHNAAKHEVNVTPYDQNTAWPTKDHRQGPRADVDFHKCQGDVEKKCTYNPFGEQSLIEIIQKALLT